MRVLFVRGYNENGTPLTLGTVLQYTGSAYAITSPYNYDNSSKYKVLYDKVWTLSSGAGVTGSTPARCLRISKKLGHEIQWSANTTTVLDGGLCVFFISDVSLNPPSVQYQTRVYFTDA